MRCLCLPAVAVVLASCFSGCSSTGISATASYNPGYGPFDRNGNYVEAWADKPPKKHGGSRETAPSRKPEPAPAADPPQEAPVLVSTSPRRESASPRRETISRVVTHTPPPRPTENRPLTATRPPEPKPESRPPVVAARTTPKPAAAPPKPTPKPAPAAVSHSVQKGDTLYSLSRRYGTSVSAIQKANGISGTNIRIGQSLKIPK
jgi:LysM repeat protein